MNFVLIGALSAGIFLLLRTIKESDKISKLAKSRLNQNLINQIERVSDTLGVPANIVASIVIVESSGNPAAIGKAGERGLMQLTEVALKDVNDNTGTNFNFNQMFSPVQNLAAGSLFFKLQLKRFSGDTSQAIRAFNCGQAGAIGGCGFPYLILIKVWI